MMSNLNESYPNISILVLNNIEADPSILALVSKFRKLRSLDLSDSKCFHNLDLISAFIVNNI